MSEERMKTDGAGSRSRHLVAPELLAALDHVGASAFDPGQLTALREAMATMVDAIELTPEQAAVACEERRVSGAAGAPDVRVLVYRPPASNERPCAAYLHLHGGGYMVGSPELSDAANRTLARKLGCVVVSVDYRLAPETVWPGALDDAYAALVWLHDEAATLGIDPARIAIGGESAGGGHAAALALHARDRGGPPIRLQMLDSPMLDDRTGSSGEAHPYCGEFVWPAASNGAGWRALLGREPGGADVPTAAVPGRCDDLAGLPAAFIVVGALDLFLEESLDYARRLARNGVPVELHVIPGAFHGFAMVGASPQTEELVRLRDAALDRALASDGAEPVRASGAG